MNDDRPTPLTAHDILQARLARKRAARKRPRRPRTIKRDCPECFRENGHEVWCKKSE